jgi:hypothetical protein
MPPSCLTQSLQENNQSNRHSSHKVRIVSKRYSPWGSWIEATWGKSKPLGIYGISMLRRDFDNEDGVVALALHCVHHHVLDE